MKNLKPVFVVFCIAILFESCAPKDDFSRISARVPLKPQISPRGPELAETREVNIEVERTRRPVKLFFVIDDSSSTLQFQETLQKNAEGWLKVIGADFIGEVHSVTTTELSPDGMFNFMTMSAVTYPSLLSDNTPINRTIGQHVFLQWPRAHYIWPSIETWVGWTGVISPVRSLYSLNTDTVEIPWTPQDGKAGTVTLLSRDIYKMVKPSLVDTFSGEENQIERLKQALSRATIRMTKDGAGNLYPGGAKEQPYCALIHALKDTGRLNIFKPEDKVAFVFLLHGDADLVPGETCIRGFEMKAEPQPTVPYVVERFGVRVQGGVLARRDQNDEFRPDTNTPGLETRDCIGPNASPFCLFVVDQLASAKTARLSQPIGVGLWHGEQYKDCSWKASSGILYEDSLEGKYEYWLTHDYLYKDLFLGPNPLKRFERGQCTVAYGFSMGNDFSVNVQSSLLGQDCSNVSSSLYQTMTVSVDAHKIAHSAEIFDRDLCYSIGNSHYKTMTTKKLYFEGLGETATAKDYGIVLSGLMDSKIGRTNYMVSAITTLGTEDSSCAPADFKAHSLIDLIKRSPTPDEITSICQSDYTPALKRIEQFALFDTKRHYQVKELPTMDRLLKVRVMNTDKIAREISQSQVVISADRKTITLDKSLEIQPDEKLLLDYGKERLDLDGDGFIYDVDCDDANPTGWSNCQDSDKDGYMSDSDIDDGNPEKH